MLVVAPDIQEWTIERRSRPSTNWTTRTSSTWPQLRIGFISRPPPVNRIYYRHVLVDWAERCLYTSICSIVNTWCVKLNTSTSTVEWFGFPFVDITKRYSISWHKQWKRRKIKNKSSRDLQWPKWRWQYRGRWPVGPILWHLCGYRRIHQRRLGQVWM